MTLQLPWAKESMLLRLPSHGVAFDRLLEVTTWPHATTEEYYRSWDLTVPFLDEIIAHICSRSSELQKKAIMALSIVPSVLIRAEHEQTPDSSSTSDLADQLAELYMEPSVILTGAAPLEVQVEDHLS